MFDDFNEKSGFWSRPGPAGDVVLSTRVRLARNLASAGFPHHQDEAESQLIKTIARRFAAGTTLNERLTVVDLGDIDLHEKRYLRERNIITSELEKSTDGLVIFNESGDMVVMVNEEDHFRIQVLRPGLQIMDAYRAADRVDDDLNRFVSYAYSDELGYLTACPSNIGTALRLSAMLHLPALTLLKSIPDVVKVAREYGAELRGTLGEENRTMGSMFIISNRVTLGKSEVDLLEEADEVAMMVIEMENEARDDYVSRFGRQMEDRVYRSFGVLKHSRLLSYPDSMEHLSNVRLGVILSLIKNIELSRINDLMIHVQWSHLQKGAGAVFSSGFECDCARSDYLRAQFI